MTGSKKLIRHFNQKIIDDPMDGPISGNVPLPRHSVLPDVPQTSGIVFEIAFLIYSIMILGLQLLTLYNTAWWMPFSESEMPLNVQAIDFDLITLLLLLLSRNLLLKCFSEVFDKRGLDGLVYFTMKWFIWLVYHIPVLGTFLVVSSHYSFVQSTCILLPCIFQFLLFGPNILPYVSSLLPERWFNSDKKEPYDILIPPPTEKTSQNIYHACSRNPEHIRREVYFLKTDFNYRLKLVYCEALIPAFYAAVVPLILCRTVQPFSVNWIICFVVTSSLTAVLLRLVHRVPVQYLDVMHRCSLHLGSWQKFESRASNIPQSVWSELAIWPKGVLVKHVKGVFKAEGINNTAEPGNRMHYKFYVFFCNPEYACALIAILVFLLVTSQFIALWTFKQWYQMLSLTVLILSNYYTLFRAVRDYLILSRVYVDENK